MTTTRRMAERLFFIREEGAIASTIFLLIWTSSLPINHLTRIEHLCSSSSRHVQQSGSDVKKKNIYIMIIQQASSAAANIRIDNK